MTVRYRHSLYMALVPVIFFILLDLFLRLSGINPYEKKPLPPQVSFTLTNLYKKGTLPGGRDGYVATVNRKDPYWFQPIPDEKAKNTVFVFVLGGSAPSGFPFSGRIAFSQWLKAGLESVYPEKAFHIVNACMPGIPLSTVSTAVQEMLNYQPDLIIIYSGNNEYRNLREETAVFRNSGIGARLLRLCWKLRSFQVLHYLIVGRKPAFDWQYAFKETRTPHDADEFSYLLEHYDTALRSIYQKASGRNVPLIFCTVPVNEKDWPPYESVHSTRLRQNEQDEFRRDLRKAYESIQTNRPQAALKICEKLVAKDNHYALAHFLMGKALEHTKQYDRAETAYLMALEHDRTRMRAFGALNRKLTDFCSDHDIPVADCVKRLRRHAPNGLLGYEQFMDNCHPRPSAHRIISREVARAIMKTGILPAPPVDWPARFEDGLVRCYEALVITEKEFALAYLSTAKALLEGITFRMDPEALTRAENLLVEALKNEPQMCSGHFYLGVVYFLQGRAEQARKEWKTELKICPRFSATRITLDMLDSGRLNRSMLLHKDLFNLVPPRF